MNNILTSTIVLFSAGCTDTMSPDSDRPVVTSSNQEDADNLRSEESPRWESNPEEDDFNNPTISVDVSDEDNYISEVELLRTGNIDTVTVTVYDSEDNEVITSL